MKKVILDATELENQKYLMKKVLPTTSLFYGLIVLNFWKIKKNIFFSYYNWMTAEII